MKKTAHILRDNKKEVLETWDKEVREKVRASVNSSKINLHDHVPIIFDDLVDILERYEVLENPFADERYLKIVESSNEHGRHRAATQNYTVDEVVREYIIFHRVITNLFIEQGIEDAKPYNLIKYILETAILQSVQAFSASLQDMQEKLIATLAHDIRNPLAAARMAIEMIGAEQPAARVEKVKNMSYNAVNKAIEMLEGLLETIAVQAGEGMSLNFTETDLYENILSVHTEASIVYGEKLILKNIAPGIYGVFDGIAIRRLLENLLTNAVKYGKSGKPITISLKEEKDRIYLSVHNYGPPIPEEKQKEIFDYMHHGQSEKTGKLKSWGIGLTLVKMVTQAHHGTLSLKSEADYGTEFTVMLMKHAQQPGKTKIKLNYVFEE